MNDTPPPVPASAAPASPATSPPAAPAAPPVAQPAAPATWQPDRRRRLVYVGIAVVGLCALVAVLAAWRLFPFDQGDERTDNAYVRGRTTVIAPQVSGYVVEVLVRDYETVTAGQVLARIDDRIYASRVEQAKANLDAALANLRNSTQARLSRVANLDSQVANLNSARAQLLRAKADMSRAEELTSDGSVSIRERDQTLAALRQAEATVQQATAAGEIARQDIRTVDVGRGALEAQVEAATAQVHSLQIDLDHTVIRAPEAGQLGEIGVRLGVYVTNGTQLMTLVPAERWVIANFKEAQTWPMTIGQRASFTVDALDGRRFTGRVESLSPAAGSEFAVLKPDNATGNFIKVPQRIGVRIAIDPDQQLADRLRPGMSVEAAVDTHRVP